MSKALCKSKEVELYNSCFEDFNPNYFSMNNTIDLVFTSPPYFCKEIYTDEETQSRIRYKTYEEWHDKFLIELLKRSYILLKEDSYCIINIQDVKIKDKVYPLVNDTKTAGKRQGFTFEKEERFELSHRMGVTSEDNIENKRATEAILFFKK